MVKWYYAKESTYDVEKVRTRMKEEANGRKWLSFNEIINIGWAFMESARSVGQLRDYENMLYEVFPFHEGDRWYFSDPSSD